MKQAILARHAESEFSVRGAMNGDPGVACPLTELGRRQARRLGELLAEERVDICVTSDFERVRETADIALAGRDVPRLVVPELGDIRVGAFEGKLLTEYREWAHANGPTVDAPGGGESRAATARRYARAFRTVLALDEPTVLVVAHGLPIRYVLNAAQGIDPAPIVEQVAYAEPVILSAADLGRAVDRLAAWAGNPVWSAHG